MRSYPRKLLVLAVLASLTAPMLWVSSVQTNPALATDAPAPAAAANQTAQALRDRGFRHAVEGRFEVAVAELARASQIEPDNPATAQALALMQEHMTRRDRFRAERRSEYERAVRRVHRSVLAQAQQASYDAEWRQELQKLVRDELGKGLTGTAGSDLLGDAPSAEAAGDLREEALAAIAASDARAQELLDRLEGQSGQLVDEIAAAVNEYRRVLEAYRQAWQDAELATAADRTSTAIRLHPGEENLADARGDLEILVAQDPWRFSLRHAYQAKELAAEGVDVTSLDWYQELLADMKVRARRLTDEASWEDALTIYLELEQIDPTNDAYQEQSRVLRRHVRVLRLYGRQATAARNDSDEEEVDSGLPPRERGVDWREMVAGVDAQMVHTIISRLSTSYVTTVDFRKLARGGLESVLVLAETPQVAETFPGLADADKQARFVSTVRRTLQNIEQKDRVDHLDVQLALRTILLASASTVQIPLDVLSVEFTDGLLDELDKFSSMVWPYDYEDFTKQTMGHFSGVGIQISKQPGQPLRVETPLPDSPAYRAGIRANDLVIRVDGEATEHYALDRLVRMITGERGTIVRLSVRREGVPQELEFDVRREEIHIHTVLGWRRLENGRWDFLLDPEAGIGYIRLTQFTEKSREDLLAALAELEQAGARGLILDMRFNPGGLLRSATEIANEFLSRGAIVSTRGRQVQSSVAHANAQGAYLQGDLVVLINEYSASAAEIVSGALKDWQRATIVGSRTYGKGSVQNVIPVPDKRALLKLTTAYYYLPSGRLLHRENGSDTWGVDPDVEVTLTPRQMVRWRTIQRKTDRVHEVDAAELNDQLREQYDSDLQLDTAVLVLRLRQLQSASTTRAVAVEAPR